MVSSAPTMTVWEGTRLVNDQSQSAWTCWTKAGSHSGAECGWQDFIMWLRMVYTSKFMNYFWTFLFNVFSLKSIADNWNLRKKNHRSACQQVQKILLGFWLYSHWMYRYLPVGELKSYHYSMKTRSLFRPFWDSFFWPGTIVFTVRCYSYYILSQ